MFEILLFKACRQLKLTHPCPINLSRPSMQVSSATALFAMTFSSSMSVVEYYLLKRFPVPYGSLLAKYQLNVKCFWPCFEFRLHVYLSFFNDYTALYFFALSIIAAFVGQHVVKKLIKILGRASIIIFTLSFIIFVSAVSLGMRSRSSFIQLLRFLAVDYEIKI